MERIRGYALLLASTVLIASTNFTFQPIRNSQVRLLSANQSNALIRLSAAATALALLLQGKSLLDEADDTDVIDDSSSPSSSLPIEPLLNAAKDSANNPHIMIVGKTGGGKSTLAQYLAALSPGKRFVLSPHFDRTKPDWAACHGIFGTGRNYGTSEDEAIDYNDLITGKLTSPTSYQVLQAILAEMDRRYRQEVAFETHECHNWIIDESPAVARALDKLFSTTVAPILFEARKVGIRLWIISQSAQVETLKIKGQGKLREQFTRIYLANSAIERVKSMRKRLPITNGRWCVVEDEIAAVPDLVEMKEALEANEVKDRFIAEFPVDEGILPSPATWLTRDPTESELELLRRKAEEIKEDNPDITDSNLNQLLGFSGRYYQLGKKIRGLIDAN